MVEQSDSLTVHQWLQKYWLRRILQLSECLGGFNAICAVGQSAPDSQTVRHGTMPRSNTGNNGRPLLVRMPCHLYGRSEMQSTVRHERVQSGSISSSCRICFGRRCHATCADGPKFSQNVRIETLPRSDILRHHCLIVAVGHILYTV